MGSYFILAVFVFMILAGCIATEPASEQQQPLFSAPAPTVPVIPEITATPFVQPTPAPEEQYKEPPHQENYSTAKEVNYREYVDWFLLNNNNIRYYTLDEYVCGQYTVDMINASENAGFKAYFGTIRFSDGTGHALVAFKSGYFGDPAWYFFEPQTNNRMTEQTIRHILQEKMGKKVTEVTVYGYYDDAGDKDPASWRFAYPLYNKKY